MTFGDINFRVDRSATSRRARVVPLLNRALSLSVAAISRAIAAVSRSIAAVSRSIAAISRSIAAVSRSVAVVSRSIAAVSRFIAVVGGAVSRPIAARSVFDRRRHRPSGRGSGSRHLPAENARIRTLTKHKAQPATALDDTKPPHRTHNTHDQKNNTGRRAPSNTNRPWA